MYFNCVLHWLLYQVPIRLVLWIAALKAVSLSRSSVCYSPSRLDYTNRTTSALVRPVSRACRTGLCGIGCTDGRHTGSKVYTCNACSRNTPCVCYRLRPLALTGFKPLGRSYGSLRAAPHVSVSDDGVLNIRQVANTKPRMLHGNRRIARIKAVVVGHESIKLFHVHAHFLGNLLPYLRHARRVEDPRGTLLNEAGKRVQQTSFTARGRLFLLLCRLLSLRGLLYRLCPHGVAHGRSLSASLSGRGCSVRQASISHLLFRRASP